MTKEEALKLLKLSSNYNEDTLNSSYKSIINELCKYYDENKGDGEKQILLEKINELKEAKKILYDNIKNINHSNKKIAHPQKKKNANNPYIPESKIKYYKLVSEELKTINSIDSMDKNFRSYIISFYCINKEFEQNLSKANTNQEITNVYDKYTLEYLKLIKSYLNTISITSEIKEIKQIPTSKGIKLKDIRSKVIMTISSKINYNQTEEPVIIKELKNKYVDWCLYGYINIDNANKQIKEEIDRLNTKVEKRKRICKILSTIYEEENIPKYYYDLYTNISDEKQFNKIYQKISQKTKIKILTRRIFSKKES